MSDAIKLRYQVPPELMLAAAYSGSLDPDGQQKRKSRWGGRFGSIALWTVLFLAILYLLNFPQVASPTGYLTLGLLLGVAASVGYWMMTCSRLNTRLKEAASARDKLRGETVTTFDKVGISYLNAHERYDVCWAGVDHIVGLDKGTGIRIGVGTIPVPDSALPKELSADAFRKQLLQWKDED